MTMPIPDFKTDAFFGLQDHWIATADNELTHYYDLGQGTPVLFLHGSGTGVSAAANWWKNLDTIGQSYRAIAFDFIGYGETVVPSDVQYGIKQWADHTIRLMDALKLDKVWLVGNSLGGWVAFQIAIDYPERLHDIISMGTGGAKLNQALASHAKPDISREGIRRGLGLMTNNQDLISEELVELRYAAALKDEAEGRLQPVVQARDRDRDALPLDMDKLAQFTLPVLLVHGKDDKVIPLSRTWELVQVIPNADAHIFSNAGHWIQIERSDEFNQVVTSFLAQRESYKN